MANHRLSEGDTDPKSRYFRLYNIWIGIRRRCRDAKHKDYKHYGAKGITVSDDWYNSYLSFKKWSLENNYSDSKSIDRIDGTKGYDIHNCRWASIVEQNSNRKSNVYVRYKNKILTLAQLADEVGISRNTIKTRYQRYGDNLQELLKEVADDKMITLADGSKIDRKQGAKILGIPYRTLMSRYRTYGDNYLKLGWGD